MVFRLKNVNGEMDRVVVPLLDLPALEKTPGGALAPKLIFSVCYGAWLIATLWASEVPW